MRASVRGKIAPMGWMSLRQAANYYGIPPRTLSRWIEAGLACHERAERRGEAMRVWGPDVARLAEHYEPGAGRGKLERLRAAAFPG